MKSKSTPPSESHFPRREITGILEIALGLFVLISVYRPGATGTIGTGLISIGLSHTVGMGIHLFPYFLILLGISTFVGHQLIAMRWRNTGLLLIFLSLITGWDILNAGLIQNFDFIRATQGGGGVGRILNFLLHWMGNGGAYLVIGTTALIGLVMSTNFTWGTFLEKWNAYHEQQKVIPKEKIKTTEKKDSIKPFINPSGDDSDAENKLELVPLRKRNGRKEKTKETEDGVFELLKPAHGDTYVGDYKLPPLTLLEKPKPASKANQRDREEDIKILEDTLQSFNVEAKVVEVCYGPAITRYELEPGTGVRINKIANLADDIALSLASGGVRIEAPVPGKAVVGVEIPNAEIHPVSMMEIATSDEFKNAKSPLVCALGKDVTGTPIVFDLNKMPHLLIAGATGSGKSVCINSIITSILLRNRPDEVKFIMIDPKKVELSLYDDIPHLLTPVVTDPKLAAVTLKKWAIKEMERRYDIFSAAGVKNIDGYNRYIEKAWGKSTPEEIAGEGGGESSARTKIPYIVVIIDELADLMMVASSDVESSIIRLAQLARATGIHLVVATQRPSVNVITGLIKANIPSRIAFAVSSQIDSRTILDSMGAEKLLGRGDMLYSPIGVFKPFRLQGVFLSDQEVQKIVHHVKKQASPTYDEELKQIEAEGVDADDSRDEQEDEFYDEAKQILKESKKPSISYLQRRLRIGYNRAARLFETLEAQGEIFREVDA